MELVHRDLVVKANTNRATWPGLKDSRTTALISMADPTFQDCVIQLLRTARRIKWVEPIYLLAINYAQFDKKFRSEMDTLGVFVIDTKPVLDPWLARNRTSNHTVYRRLQPYKFRKMEVFLNPIFRTYERLIFLDADGELTNLGPMVTVSFPPETAILMRQNDKSFNKKSLHENEIGDKYLTTKQLKLLQERYPNRTKTGATAYFIVDVKKLPTPHEVYEKSVDILVNFRSGFRLNDQTLMNFLFYHEMEIFPYCSWDEIVLIEDTKRLRDYCRKNIETQKKLLGKKSFLYRHKSVSEKANCLRVEDKEKSRSPKAKAKKRSKWGIW